LEEPLSGEFKVESYIEEDIFSKQINRKFFHNSLFGGGGIGEVFYGDKKEKKFILKKDNMERVFASSISYKKGKLVWIRGSLPYLTEKFSYQPHILNFSKYYDPGEILRYILSELGFKIYQKRFVNVENEKENSESAISCKPTLPSVSRPVVMTISRNHNSFILSGCKPSSDVVSYLSFPEGAPLIKEREVEVKDNFTIYSFDKTFLHECRIFLQQKGNSIVQCKELPVPVGYNRCLKISGIRNGSISIYPESFEKLKVKKNGKEIKFKKIGEKVFVGEKKGEINGEIEILW